MTLNGILLNKRLIWMAYYLNYAGEQTIDILEQQNMFLIQEIIHQNNYGK
jgi:hypothetical protein